MAITSKHRQGTRYLAVGLIGMAAAVGYWCGMAPGNDPPVSQQRSIPQRNERERITADGDSKLTAVEVVREAVEGTLDERRQWQLIRGFTEEEVKAAFRELGGWGKNITMSTEATMMLFYRWGELDPVAANARAKELFPKGFTGFREAVIAAWIKQGGGAAAWNAVRDETEMWACTRSVQGEVAEMLVASLSDQDDATAFREVRRLDDENCGAAGKLCRLRAGKACATAESRAAFLAAAADHPEPYVLGCAREWLFREWARNDPEAARAGAMAMPISQKEREEIQFWINIGAGDRKRDAEHPAD